jgi:ribosomal protein S18 acetylase RimI-like enzyme
MEITYRAALAADATAVAALHADSWRRFYRGSYSDAFLDGPVDQDRLEVWSKRLDDQENSATVLAEIDGALVGFVHVVFDADPIHGALIDNLHVRHDMQRRGLGAELVHKAMTAVISERGESPVYLWVLEQNTRAQAFYASLGGQVADRQTSTPPGGGSVTIIRIVWPSGADR